VSLFRLLRLDDAVDVLTDCVAVFTDPNSSEIKYNDHMNHINTLVIPLLKLAAVTALKAGK
jgi:hypothetical protein